MKTLLLVILCIAVSACATTGVSTGLKFEKAEPPLPGYARAYIFRPGFSKEARSGSPTVVVDGEKIFSLAYESYSAINLRSGKHRIRLSPETFDSSIWEAETEISVEAGKTYFLAIWNNVEYTKGVGIAYVPGPTPFVLPMPTDSWRSKNVQFEVVPENDALPIIQLCTFIKPARDSID